MSRVPAALTDLLDEPENEDGPDLQSLLDGIELLNQLERNLAEMQTALDKLTIRNT